MMSEVFIKVYALLGSVEDKLGPRRQDLHARHKKKTIGSMIKAAV